MTKQNLLNKFLADPQSTHSPFAVAICGTWLVNILRTHFIEDLHCDGNKWTLRQKESYSPGYVSLFSLVDECKKTLTTDVKNVMLEAILTHEYYNDESKPFARFTLVDANDEEQIWFLTPKMTLILAYKTSTYEECWQSDEKNNSVELRHNRIRQVVANLHPRLCDTGIRNEMVLCLDGYNGKRVIVELSLFFTAFIQQYLESTWQNSGISLQNLLKKIWSPWILNQTMSDQLLTELSEDEHLKQAFYAKIGEMGVNLNTSKNIYDEIKNDITYLFSKTNLEDLRCDFAPYLTTLGILREKYGPSFINVDAKPHSCFGLWKKIVEWINADNDGFDPANEAHVSLVFKLEILFDVFSKIDLADAAVLSVFGIKEELCNYAFALRNEADFISTMLSKTDEIDEKIQLFYQCFSKQELAKTFLETWFDNERAVNMLWEPVFQHEIEVTDEAFSFGTPFQQILCHALITPVANWSGMFREKLKGILDALKNSSKIHRGYSILLLQLNYLLACANNDEEKPEKYIAILAPASIQGAEEIKDFEYHSVGLSKKRINEINQLIIQKNKFKEDDIDDLLSCDKDFSLFIDFYGKPSIKLLNAIRDRNIVSSIDLTDTIQLLLLTPKQISEIQLKKNILSKLRDPMLRKQILTLKDLGGEYCLINLAKNMYDLSLFEYVLSMFDNLADGNEVFHEILFSKEKLGGETLIHTLSQQTYYKEMFSSLIKKAKSILNDEELSTLFCEKDNAGRSFIHSAISSAPIASVIDMVMNYPEISMQSDSCGRSMLHIAIISERFDLFFELLKLYNDKEAALMAQDFGGNTVFHYAALKHRGWLSFKKEFRLSCCDFSLFGKAIVSKNQSGKTPLYLLMRAREDFRVSIYTRNVIPAFSVGSNLLLLSLDDDAFFYINENKEITPFPILAEDFRDENNRNTQIELISDIKNSIESGAPVKFSKYKPFIINYAFQQKLLYNRYMIVTDLIECFNEMNYEGFHELILETFKMLDEDGNNLVQLAVKNNQEFSGFIFPLFNYVNDNALLSLIIESKNNKKATLFHSVTNNPTAENCSLLRNLLQYAATKMPSKCIHDFLLKSDLDKKPPLYTLLCQITSGGDHSDKSQFNKVAREINFFLELLSQHNCLKEALLYEINDNHDTYGHIAAAEKFFFFFEACSRLLAKEKSFYAHIMTKVFNAQGRSPMDIIEFKKIDNAEAIISQSVFLAEIHSFITKFNIPFIENYEVSDFLTIKVNNQTLLDLVWNHPDKSVIICFIDLLIQWKTKNEILNDKLTMQIKERLRVLNTKGYTLFHLAAMRADGALFKKLTGFYKESIDDVQFLDALMTGSSPFKKNPLSYAADRSCKDIFDAFFEKIEITLASRLTLRKILTDRENGADSIITRANLNGAFREFLNKKLAEIDCYIAYCNKSAPVALQYQMLSNKQIQQYDFFRKQDDNGEHRLHALVRDNKANALKFYLSTSAMCNGGNKTLKEVLLQTDKQGQTSLGLAFRTKSQDAFILLVNSFASIDDNFETLRKVLQLERVSKLCKGPTLFHLAAYEKCIWFFEALFRVLQGNSGGRLLMLEGLTTVTNHYGINFLSKKNKDSPGIANVLYLDLNNDVLRYTITNQKSEISEGEINESDLDYEHFCVFKEAVQNVSLAKITPANKNALLTLLLVRSHISASYFINTPLEIVKYWSAYEEGDAAKESFHLMVVLEHMLQALSPQQDNIIDLMQATSPGFLRRIK